MRGLQCYQKNKQSLFIMVAQLLFVSVRARRDVQTPVAFLMTKVKSPDVGDWGKLTRVQKYLIGTKTLKLPIQHHMLSMMILKDALGK